MPALPRFPASLAEAAARATIEASRQWARAATVPGRRRGRIAGQLNFFDDYLWARPTVSEPDAPRARRPQLHEE